MNNTIILQLYYFLIYMLSGAMIGILFDFFRILRKSFNTPDFITYIEDILFCILTGIILLFVLFNFSNGQIRIYNIFAILLGSAFYMILISKYFIKINVKIIVTIKNIVIKIINILLIPLKILFTLFRKLITPFTFLVINIRKMTINSTRKINNKVKNNKKILIKRRNLNNNVEKYNKRVY